MSSSEHNKDAKRLAGCALGVVSGVAFALFCPDVGLSVQGVRCLGILIGAIAWWVTGVLPEYATGIVMVVLFAIVGGIPSTTALASFSSDTWWLLVAAFGLGAGMKKSGLLKRMAIAILRVFPNTFSAQVAGLLAAGTVLGPLVPSLSAKTTMLTPIAMNIGDALGYERYGKPMSGLFLAMLAGVRNVGPAVVSASIIGYALMGLLPADVRAQFDMLHWLMAALPWFALVTALNFAAIVVLYRPRGKQRDRGEGNVDARMATVQHGSKTAMSRHEKQMCAIILATVACWVAEPIHHVPAHIVALAAFAATVACGILGKTGLREGIGWESLIFIGIAMGLANVFAETGIQDWIVQATGPAFEALAENPYLFVVGIGAVTIALRFVIVSEMAYLNIAMAFLVPLATNAGISPWVVGFAIYATVNPWFLPYQNVVYLSAFYSVDGAMVRHADMARYCFLYMLFCLAALAASVPYWQWTGLL